MDFLFFQQVGATLPLWCVGFPLQWLLSWSMGSRQELWCMGLVAAQHVESSWTRDWNCVPCISGQILNHWTIREVLSLPFDCGGVPACPALCFNVSDIDTQFMMCDSSLMVTWPKVRWFSATTRTREQNRAISQRRILIHRGWHICSKFCWSMLWFTYESLPKALQMHPSVPQTLRVSLDVLDHTVQEAKHLAP